MSRQTQSRFKARTVCLQRRSIFEHIKAEETLQANQEKIYSSVQEVIKSRYRFVPDMDRTVHQNSVSLLAAMPYWQYYIEPSNLVFYDFTVGKVVLPAATSLFGLSSKFIVKPNHTAAPDNL